MNLPIQTHLFKRNSTYYFRRRIPLEFIAHYHGKQEITLSLRTKDLREAERLSRLESVRLDAEFEEIKRISSTLTNSVLQAKSTLTLELMRDVVEQMVHSKIAEDGAMRSRGYHADPVYKSRALNKLINDERIVKEAITQGNFEGLQDSASTWLKGHGYQITIGSPEFRAFAELFAEGMSQVNAATRERDKGNVINEPKLPASHLKESASNSNWDSLDKLRDYWLLQPAKSSGGKKSRTAETEATTIIKKFKAMIGNLKPSEVSRSHIADLKDKMLEAGSSVQLS